MTRLVRTLLLVTVAALALAPDSLAQSVATSPTDAKAAAVEREAKQIETLLIAPCCWKEQVSRHHSEATEKVKEEVRGMLSAGLNRQQILDRFVASYGTRILAEPPNQGFSRLLHHMPWIVGVGSMAGLFLFVRQVTRHRRSREQDETLPERDSTGKAVNGEAAYQQRLDDELRDMD